MTNDADPGRRLPLFLRADEAADDLLREGLQFAQKTKEVLRAFLIQLDPDLGSRRAVAQGGPAAQGSKGAGVGVQRVMSFSPPASANPKNRVTNPTCTITFEPGEGVTTMVGTVTIQASPDEIAAILDPRAWSCTGGAIAASFVVETDLDRQYQPAILEKVALGQSWPDKIPRLLYEYARSEVASFENILSIKHFTVTPDSVRAEYELHDCLVCTFGAFSAPGGLTMNEGSVEATPAVPDRYDVWTVEVVKKIRVRDLTPNDPGNPYDFGTWVNSTIGAALGEWVHDARLFSPVL